MNALLPDPSRTADISPDGVYRYVLTRSWWSTFPKPMRGTVLFILLNPSTADAMQDDPTIRRLVAFAQRWGYGELRVVNLFAYRATDPDALRRAADPVGPRNDAVIAVEADVADLVVCGWGRHGSFIERGESVRRSLSHLKLYTLHINQDGSPGHPLYLRGDVSPVEWKASGR